MNPALWSVPAPAGINLFFALRPPDAMRPRLEALGDTLKRAHRLRGRAITGNRLHNTLAPLPAQENALKAIIARARRAGDRVRHAAFPVRYEWTGSFRNTGGAHPLALQGGDGLNPLREFRRLLAGELRREGFHQPEGFTPHVTLLWADRRVDDHPIAPLQWTAPDFTLVASLVGQARHIALASWPLA